MTTIATNPEQEDYIIEPWAQCPSCGNELKDKWETYLQLVQEYVKKGLPKHTADSQALNDLKLNRYCCRIRLLEPNIIAKGAPGRYTESYAKTSTGTESGAKTKSKNIGAILLSDTDVEVTDEPINYLKLKEKKEKEKIKVEDIVVAEAPMRLRAVGEGYYVQVLTEEL